MVLSSDNGGYVKNDNGGCNTTSGMDGLPSTDSGHGGACFNGEAGANNFPLRAGSKRPTFLSKPRALGRLLNPQALRCAFRVCDVRGWHPRQRIRQRRSPLAGKPASRACRSPVR